MAKSFSSKYIVVELNDPIVLCFTIDALPKNFSILDSTYHSFAFKGTNCYHLRQWFLISKVNSRLRTLSFSFVSKKSQLSREYCILSQVYLINNFTRAMCFGISNRFWRWNDHQSIGHGLRILVTWIDSTSNIKLSKTHQTESNFISADWIV